MFKGMGNMGNLVKKAQEMQKKMAEVQEELKDTKVSGESADGMIKVVANCKKDILSINIDEGILTEDKDMVEDLVLVAIKQALSNADKKSEEMMKNVTGGSMPNFNIPGF
tara:strand:+ start:232 stop:561 length:330 start_codon:yes stop_codon:yes gene_type:complete